MPSALDHTMQGARTLGQFGVLRGISGPDAAHLAVDCRWRTVSRGAAIVTADAGSSDVHLVESGRVRVTYYSPSGREVAFRDLGPGASFGELAAIDGHARSASVVALDETAIATISGERFWRLLRESPEVSANVMRALAALVRDLSARIVDATTLTVSQRVRAEIVRLARATSLTGKSVLIVRSPTHAELASQIGATREAVSRELSRMAGDGLVERRGRNLWVHDVNGLQASIETMRDL